MKLEIFFEKFDQFADAPDAVWKMRELVLRMATSGRIAEQDPADQPGSELLKEIFAIRDNLIKHGAAKSRVEGNQITAGDTIDLPPSWARCMISEVCDLQTGATPSRAEHSYFGGDTPWLVSGDINKGEITECDGRITKEGLDNSNCKVIPANSVLIALNGQGKTRATVAVLRIPAALNQSLVAMIPYSGERLLPEYIFWNLRGRYYAIREITGQDQRRGLNMKLVGQLSIPVPPLAEQKRIVAKVDELMALCDRLEAQQQERQTRHAALARASLARFTDAPTPANLHFLFHPSYAIPPADLRKSILTLAVQGKLVPQDPNDEPAEETLTKVLRARDRQEKSLRIKEPSPVEADAEHTPELPSGWCYASPDQLTAFHKNALTIGPFGSSLLKSDYSDEGVPLVFVRDIRSESFGGPETRFVTPDKADELASHTVRPGDLLITKMGDPPGDTAIYPEGRPPAIITADCIKLTPHSDVVSAEYLRFTVRASQIAEQFAGITLGVAQQKVSLGRFRCIAVPLPPLAEQRRIVAKVEQLMALVDALEQQLAASRATAANLLSALVAELTAT